jgi:RNA polymerase sigma-70 factor (ECF subfamily)
MCRGHEDRAQDLVQDALVRGYEAFILGRFREGSNDRAWLFRILTNGFINETRRRARGAEIDLETLTAGGEVVPEGLRARPEDQPEPALMASLLEEPLERALAALSDEARIVVLLVDVEQLSYQEAARALGVPVGTVRSRLSRARLQLHQRLQGEEQSPSGACNARDGHGRR